MAENLIVTNPRPGVFARLKVGSPVAAKVTGGLSGAEKDLADIVDIGTAGRDKITQTRKLDLYLRTYNAVLKIFNGFFSRGYTPQVSTVEVEFFTPEKKPVDKEV